MIEQILIAVLFVLLVAALVSCAALLAGLRFARDRITYLMQAYDEMSRESAGSRAKWLHYDAVIKDAKYMKQFYDAQSGRLDELVSENQNLREQLRKVNHL